MPIVPVVNAPVVVMPTAPPLKPERLVLIVFPADVKLGAYNLFDVLTATVPTGSMRQQVIPQEGRTFLLSLRVASER